MFDKYDLLYGIGESRKKDLILELWTAAIVLGIQILLTGGIKFVFTWPGNIIETFNFGATTLIVGVFGSFVITYVSILKDIKRFQQKKNMLLILKEDIYSKEQIDAVKRKALVRAEILQILSMEDLSKKTKKRISKAQKRVGGTREAKAKAVYLNSVKKKFLSQEQLDKKEIQYLNELVFSEKDLELYRTIVKALKAEAKVG